VNPGRSPRRWWATLFAWVLLHEALRANQVVGGAIVLVGAYVAQSSIRASSSPAPAR
jgi:drug/metabolite transporter (DMT)-like permease